MTGPIAWRNLWRNRRRTLLTAGAIAFSVALLLFAMSMQGGTYATMRRLQPVEALRAE